MLNSLLIKNYAIIEKLELKFSDNLTIITGETGAGKSILLGALELVMGKRADTKILYDKEKKCIVEASFTTKKDTVVDIFEKYDLDGPEDILVRREISNNGKSRAFINDTPVNLTILGELSSRLLELHRQFDTLDIHKSDFQTKILDALSHNLNKVKEYNTMYRVLLKRQDLLHKLESIKVKAEEENEYLKFQFDELDSLVLENTDQESIETELSKLSNAEEIISISASIHRGLTEDENSIAFQLINVLQYLRKIRSYIPDFESYYERLGESLEEIKDVSKEIEAIGRSTVFDEERILELKDKLDEIYKVQQKHRVKTMAELIEIREGFAEKLRTHTNITIEILNLKKKLSHNQSELKKLGLEISEKRREVAPKLKTSVEEMLSKLSMEHARLQIDIQTGDQIFFNGLDEVSFLFSPNKGSQFSTIKDIASGGELSRLALCIKANVASALTLPTMIFDELDTGISGEVAMKMGDILGTLAKQHQIIAITHSPLIAAKADLHFSVYKTVEAGRTVTRIQQLNPSQKVDEIAKMLGGDPPGENAIKNAKELLQLNP